jgi:hypothetical protein
LSTQPCNLHKQTLAGEWPYWKAQWLSMWHIHRMPPFQQISGPVLWACVAYHFAAEPMLPL